MKVKTKEILFIVLVEVLILACVCLIASPYVFAANSSDEHVLQHCDGCTSENVVVLYDIDGVRTYASHKKIITCNDCGATLTVHETHYGNKLNGLSSYNGDMQCEGCGIGYNYIKAIDE